MSNSVLKILVIKDSKVLTSTYKQVLEMEGHTVVTYYGKIELEIYEKELKKDWSGEPFDLIISDNSMNGRDAAKVIHSFVPHQKFFFVTDER